jgi:hypothetical protein
LANPLLKQVPLEKMMHVSPFASSELVLIEVVDFATPHENDSEHFLHFCEGEQSSSLSTEFEPLPAGPYLVAFDHDPESISSFHDESFEIEDSWAMASYEAPILEFIGKDSTYKHGIFILDIPYESCSHNPSPESTMFSALTTHRGYNHLLVFYCRMFRRLIVDAYVYYNHIRFHVCTLVLTLQLKLH